MTPFYSLDFAQNQPIIRGVKSSYMIGDFGMYQKNNFEKIANFYSQFLFFYRYTVTANCSITFPRPHFKTMTKLNWYINDAPAPQSYVSTVKGRRMLSHLVSSFDGSMYNDEMVPGGAKESAKDDSRDGKEISDEPYGINNVIMANTIKFLVNPRNFNQGLLRYDPFI